MFTGIIVVFILTMRIFQCICCGCFSPNTGTYIYINEEVKLLLQLPDDDIELGYNFNKSDLRYQNNTNYNNNNNINNNAANKLLPPLPDDDIELSYNFNKSDLRYQYSNNNNISNNAATKLFPPLPDDDDIELNAPPHYRYNIDLQTNYKSAYRYQFSSNNNSINNNNNNTATKRIVSLQPVVSFTPQASLPCPLYSQSRTSPPLCRFNSQHPPFPSHLHNHATPLVTNELIAITRPPITDDDIEIIFTHHALDRLEKREIDQGEVHATLLSSDSIHENKKNGICSAQLKRTNVIYSKKGKKIIVITAYQSKKKIVSSPNKPKKKRRTRIGVH